MPVGDARMSAPFATGGTECMDFSSRPIIIIGGSGHGRVVADIARATGKDVAGFLDDDPGVKRTGINLLGTVGSGISQYIHSHQFVVGIGATSVRRDISRVDSECRGATWGSRPPYSNPCSRHFYWCGERHHGGRNYQSRIEHRTV